MPAADRESAAPLGASGAVLGGRDLAESMPLERVAGPPHSVTALQHGDLTLYEATLSAVPSPEWRAAFLRPPARLVSVEYTPEHG